MTAFKLDSTLGNLCVLSILPHSNHKSIRTCQRISIMHLCTATAKNSSCLALCEAVCQAMTCLKVNRDQTDQVQCVKQNTELISYTEDLTRCSGTNKCKNAG